MTDARRRIYVAYTGGTIGMTRTATGYQPEAGYLSAELSRRAVFQQPDLPEFTVHEYAPLLDSSDMSPADWNRIADDIATHYGDYDGFVVIHGTDTMAYTASALSFMLEGLQKPVILTGSQIAMIEDGSDAEANLVGALRLAASDISGVSLYFDGVLLRGNRAVKTHSRKFSAFSSPDTPALFDTRADTLPFASQEQMVTPLRIRHIRPLQIGVVHFFPGISVAQIQSVLTQAPDGVILQTFGSGNAPQSPEILLALRQASERGTVVVNHTQCLGGGVDMSTYAGGNALAEAGVVSAANMTFEATLTKLMFLLSAEGNQGDVRSLARERMSVNIAGEILY